MLPRIKIQIERWKFNKNWGVYVSTFGRIKGKNKKELKIYIDNSGYSCVFVGAQIKRVHRLVIETWCPSNNSEMTVDHIDSNKRNNALSNLEWVSQTENMQRAISNRLAETKIEYKVNKNKVIANNNIYLIEQLADVIEKNRPELPRDTIIGAIKAAAEGKSKTAFGMKIKYAMEEYL